MSLPDPMDGAMMPTSAAIAISAFRTARSLATGRINTKNDPNDDECDTCDWQTMGPWRFCKFPNEKVDAMLVQINRHS